jgi:hypothetical protein
MKSVQTLFRICFALVLSVALASGVTAADWNAHIPKGWKVIRDVAEGDAAVLVIEQDDPAKRIANDGLGNHILNTNPRRLLFLSRRAGIYHLTGSADSFLPSEGDPESACLADPLEEGGVGLHNGVLSIDLHYWLSCGSYGVSHKSYRFRKEAAGLRLIGLDISEMSRSGGTGTEISVNYLTGRKKTTTGIAIFAEDDQADAPKPKVKWSRVAKQSHYLENMDQQDCWLDDRPGWCL